MAFDAGAAQGRLILDDSQFTKATKRANKANAGLTKSVFAAQLAYDAFKKVLSGTVKIVKDSINVARDFQEENSKFRTVFRDVSQEALSMRKNLIDSFGLSKKAATELLASTGDLLTGFGFTQDSALDLSNEVQKLAVDLASFTNFSGGAKGASEALTKALLGERESVKSLGISILEADVQAKVLENTQKGITFETERQAKAYATLQIAQEQSKNASKDFERTQDQLANRQRQLLAVTEDVQVQLGSIFLPILNDITGSSLDAAKGLRDFLDSAEGIDKISSVFAGLSAGFEIFKDIAVEFGADIKTSVLAVVENLRENFTKLSESTETQISFFDILAATTTTISSAFTIAIKLNNLFIDSVFDLILAIKETGDVVGTFFKFLKKEATFDEVKESAKEAGAAFKEFGVNVKDNLEDIVETTKKEFDEFSENTKKTAHDYSEEWDTTYKEQKKSFEDSVNETLQVQEQGSQKFLSEADSTSKTWVEKWKSAGVKITTGFTKLNDNVLESMTFIVGQVSEAMNGIFETIDRGYQNQVDAEEVAFIRRQQKLEEASELRKEKIREDIGIEQSLLVQKWRDELITEKEFTKLSEKLEKDSKKRMKAENDRMDAAIIEAEKKKIKKQNEIKKKQFEAQKANQIANVWIQYAVGLVGLWSQSIAQLGPVAGSIFAGIMSAALTGIAIAQTVTISQQQFIPEAAVGGVVTQGGLVRTDEVGGEIRRLASGDTIIPNDVSMEIGREIGKSTNMGNTINVSFAGANITDNMSLRKITNHVIKEMTKQMRTT
jgi:hypothetical protein